MAGLYTAEAESLLVIEAVRAEIREAADTTGRIRAWLAVLVVSVPGLALAAALLHMVGQPHSSGRTPAVLQLSTLFIALFLVIIPFPLAAAFRQAHLRRFQSTLSRLDAEQRAQVLLPLRQCKSRDMSKIVQPLIHEFDIPAAAEVVPSAGPGGHGREPAPAPAQSPELRVDDREA